MLYLQGGLLVFECSPQILKNNIPASRKPSTSGKVILLTSQCWISTCREFFLLSGKYLPRQAFTTTSHHILWMRQKYLFERFQLCLYSSLLFFFGDRGLVSSKHWCFEQPLLSAPQIVEAWQAGKVTGEEVSRIIASPPKWPLDLSWPKYRAICWLVLAAANTLQCDFAWPDFCHFDPYPINAYAGSTLTGSSLAGRYHLWLPKHGWSH